MGFFGKPSGRFGKYKMADVMKPDLGGTPTAKSGNPVYEYIKKEDIEASFRDALIIAFAEITARIETLIALYAATAPQSLLPPMSLKFLPQFCNFLLVHKFLFLFHLQSFFNIPPHRFLC